MPSWIYGQVLRVEEDRGPAFAQQSTINWMRALAFEIHATHGLEPIAWVASFRNEVAAKLRVPVAPVDLEACIEPLVSAITLVNSLHTVADHAPARPWLRPASIVAWYYALYGAVRSMLAAIAQPAGDDHGKTMRAYQSCLAPRLPHPFDMRASRVRNEQYSPELPSVAAGGTFDLIRRFEETRACAQGMLRQYLVGTADFYAQRVKARLAKKAPNGFRTKQARALRDNALEDQIGLMHCAFRYRGKANYRDALYLAYGQRDPTNAGRFVSDLGVVARASALLAIVILERTTDRPTALAFCNDLSVFLRGVDQIEAADRFWEAIR